MAISFSDEELKTTSKVILQTPLEIDSLNDQKAKALLGQADMLKKDDANKVFYNNFKDILNAYYDESEAINGTVYTKYLDSQLEDSAQLKAGNIHYPSSPIWINISPKSVNANLGLPTSTNADHENYRLSRVPIDISQLKTGFVDGATSTTLNTAYSGGTSVSVVGGTFVAGQRVIIYGSGSSALVQVVSTTVVPPLPGPPPVPGSTTLTVTVLVAPAGTIGVGGVVRNYFSGFTNTERETGVAPYTEVFTYFKSLLDAEVLAWEGFLNNQMTALNANEAVGPEETQNNTAKTNIQNAITVIDAWQSAPLTGVGVGKYGDTALAPLESKVTGRTTEASSRVTEITTALGSVTQAGDGTFSGSGNWYKFFQWIDFRISKSSGTLFAYYNFNLILSFIDDKIVKANDKKAEYDLYMIVKKIVQEPDGTNTIKLENTTGLSVGNAVKVMDDDAPVISATISGISGQLVTLSVPISGYALNKFARLVKLL